MTEHGQRQFDAARAHGRWDAAYVPMGSVTPDTVPLDLRAAIDANPQAKATFASLNRANLFALTARTTTLKTPAARARTIAALVAMLARGEALVPLAARPKPAGRK